MNENTTRNIDISEVNAAKLYNSLSEQDKRMVNAMANMLSAMIVTLAQTGSTKENNQKEGEVEHGQAYNSLKE